MRIVVDLLGFTGSRGGTETYVRELVPRLAAALPDIEFVALTGRAGRGGVSSFFPGPVNTVEHVGPSPRSWALGAMTVTDRMARRLGSDLVWAPANFGPIVRGVPRVVTVHDAIYDDVPGGGIVERAQRTVTSWLMRRSARTADLVVTVSQAAGSGIAAQLGVPAERIRVVHNGSAPPHPVSDPWPHLRPLGIEPGRRVLLSAGNRLPHKNFDGLLAALTSLPARERPLTVIPGGGEEDPLASLVARCELGEDVVLPGWVSAEQLEALYSVATLYVCPSLAEGFGLPVLDALRRGVRAVANDIPVLREVGAECVTYADASNPTAFAAAIADSLRSPIDPGELEAATSWAETFTWERSAERTAEVLREALGIASGRS